MITTAAGIPNRDAFDIAGKGFGEGNVKLGRSPGVRKDVELRWLPGHAATIQSPTCGSRQDSVAGGSNSASSKRTADQFRTCEKAKRLLCRFPVKAFPIRLSPKGKKPYDFQAITYGNHSRGGQSNALI